MRINQFVARATGLSRRAADTAIAAGRVTVNRLPAEAGQSVAAADIVELDNHQLSLQTDITVILNKPVGYVCSRNGQGSRTVYDLLPPELHHLKPVGRLDKDSSGLLLMTTDGTLANQLTHPKFGKQKVYKIQLDKVLKPTDQLTLEKGVKLEDGLSHLQLQGKERNWTVTLAEGRNRQIRRTFAALDYGVTKLHRTVFGEYVLDDLASGNFQEIVVK